MSELLWPDDVQPSATDTTVQDSNARSQSAITGVTRVVGRPGSRLKMSMQFRALTLRKRALLRRMIAASRGGSSPFLIPDYSYVKAGSMTVTDLVSTPTFASGTTGFTAGSAFALTHADATVRATRGRNTTGTDGVMRVTNAVTVTPYQPYVGRALVAPVRGPSTGLGLRFGSTGFGAEYSSVTGLSAGYLTHAFVPYDSTAHFGISQGAVNGLAGDSLDVSLMSMSPCALVDNAPNLLLQSADASNAAWTKTRASISSTSVTLPDGSAGTVNVLKEDNTSSNTHFMSQSVTVSAAVADYCFGIALKASNRGFAQIRIRETTGSTDAAVFVNLTTGALGTPSAGGNWANIRAFAVYLGNDWWYFCVIARKTNDATTLNAFLSVASDISTSSFNGLNQDSIMFWRPTLAQSGVPTRLSSTTTAAVSSGTAQDLGGGLYTKGWPASTNGLLLAGDQVEIGGQLLILKGPVNSDAAGRAWLDIPSIRRSPADKTPVIINRPMARWIPQESENGWTNAAGAFSDAELQLIEAA